ncbi:MAG: hypothetical protein DRO23_04120 [Thermoprotei archaeon]|nr:MAG: hypothetical protein DRO23_04120 [Thermoprotei archaeon]
MEIIIEKLKPNRLRDFKKLVNEIFNERHRPWIFSALGFTKTYVARNVEHDDFIGFIQFFLSNIDEVKIGAIYYIGVKRKYWGIGVGRSLVRKAEEHFLENNAYIAAASTTSNNIKARLFFKKLGFKEYRWYELYDMFGMQFSNKLIKILRAYEDDVFLIKFFKSLKHTLI